MSERWTLVPGDRVRFDGHEWEVFVTGKGWQSDDSPICIFRPEASDRACDVIDLMRQRCELVLVPRREKPTGSC